jgi:peptidoglycan/LPS O-acetylase OafA/YrhL
MGMLRTITDHYRKPRVLGLDILRIIASFSVIFYHGNLFRAFGRNGFTAIVAANGYLAVDIFFVLSGWLLTRQVLRMRGAFRSPTAFATRFWTRRWMRTLPLYWVVLVGVVVLGLGPTANMSPPQVGPLLLVHAAFLQTVLVSPFKYLSGVAWSLVAEEWFYLLLPFAILVAFMLRNWRLRLGLVLAILLTPTAVRAIMFASPVESWRVFTLPQARFDGLVVGALLAAASLHAPWWERRVMPRRGALAALALVVLAGTLLFGLSQSTAFNVFGVLAFCLGIALVMPFMSRLRWWAGAPVAAVMTIAYLSELTYPLYLLHPLVQLHWTHVTGGMRIAYAFLEIGLLMLAATALHLIVERPFLAWRDRRERSWKEPVVEATPHPGPPPQGGREMDPQRGREIESQTGREIEEPGLATAS